jgi:hypothetical protein
MPAVAELGLQYSITQREKRPVTRDFLPEVDGYHSVDERRVSESTTLREHLDLVAKRKREWARVLGPQKKFLNYDPVLARVNFELAKTDGEKEIFRRVELKNIQTALRERHHAAESELILSIDQDGKIRAGVQAHEPWEDVVERGRVHRAELGSEEQLREQAEVDGFKEIQADLAHPDTPKGKKRIVISRPGKAGGPYPDNYIDIYEKAQDPETGEFYINYTRFISPLNDRQTERIIKRIDPAYFDGENIPRDAWYLQKPIAIEAGKYTDIRACFDALFEKDVRAMGEESFIRDIWSVSVPAALYLIDELSKSYFDPLGIAKAENTLLLTPDRDELKQKAREVTVFLKSDATRLNEKGRLLMGNMSDRYGYERPRSLMGGCGSSGGTEITKNSVSKFGLSEDQHGSRTFKCPSCGEQNTRDYGELRSECQHCESTDVACEPTAKQKKPEHKAEPKKEEKAPVKKETLVLAA